MSVNATGLASAQAEVYASYKTDTSAKTESASKKNASAKADTASKTEEKNESGVVYDKSDKSSDTGKATYSVNKMSAEDRAALVKQLKADQESRQQQLTNIVKQMMGQQATMFATSDDSMWKFLAKGNYTVDAFVWASTVKLPLAKNFHISFACPYAFPCLEIICCTSCCSCCVRASASALSRLMIASFFCFVVTVSVFFTSLDGSYTADASVCFPSVSVAAAFCSVLL